VSKKITITKEELRTDFFLSHSQQVAAFIGRHTKSLMILVAAIVVVSVGWLAVGYLQSHKEKIASAAFYPVEKKITDEMEKTKTVSDAAIADYEKVLVEYPSSRATLVSLVSVTPVLMKANKTEKAAAWFKKLTFSPGSSEFHFALLKMTEGLLALETKQADQAISDYQAVLSSDAQKAFHPEALLKSGIAFEMKNDNAKAKEAFERVRREHPTSESAELAFQYLLYLQTKKGA
jgi:outer membrane protein assembly factor BamD (BamD/ComL family)